MRIERALSSSFRVNVLVWRHGVVGALAWLVRWRGWCAGVVGALVWLAWGAHAHTRTVGEAHRERLHRAKTSIGEERVRVSGRRHGRWSAHVDP